MDLNNKKKTRKEGGGNMPELLPGTLQSKSGGIETKSNGKHHAKKLGDSVMYRIKEV